MEKFDFNTIKDFDNHINLSIPNYSFLKNNIKLLIEALTEKETNVLDLGCSTGSLLLEIDKDPTSKYYGYDISKLLPKENIENIKFLKEDITKVELPKNCSVISSVFTLQFLQTHKREDVIKKVYDSLNKNGYFIMCEKTYSAEPLLESITNSIYYRYKAQYFTPEEILKKQQELTSVMKLKTINEIFDELKCFSHVDIFWKSYGFCGFIAKK